MMVKLAGVIVLYNPDGEQVIENIRSYIDELDFLIAVNNSDKLNQDQNLLSFFQTNEKIEYINNEQNLGIARALNIGAKRAIEQGYCWLITMDQDSMASSTMIAKMKDYISNNAIESVGIISPFHMHGICHLPEASIEKYEEVTTVMTSGNILNLNAFLQVGEFKECLFIDYVDHEYCLRLKKHDFKIITVCSAVLIHNLGQFKSYWLANTTNHNFTRRYYITRNRLLIRKLYKKDFPQFCNQDYFKMWKELIKVILLEKGKIKKIHAFFLGFYHYKINRFGKLNLNE